MGLRSLISGLRVVVPTIICLVLAVSPLGAAFISYDTSPTLISTPVAYTATFTTTDDESIPPQYRYTVATTGGCEESCSLGSVVFELPPLNLPAGSTVLSALLGYSFSYNVDTSGAVTVTPIDPTQPAVATTVTGYHIFGNISLHSPWPGESSVALFDRFNNPQGMISGGGGDFTEVVRSALATNGQITPMVAEIFLHYVLPGSGNAIEAGQNSVTVDSHNLRVVDPRGAVSLMIEYEAAAIPEPSTMAPLLLVGAIGVALKRKKRS